MTMTHNPPRAALVLAVIGSLVAPVSGASSDVRLKDIVTLQGVSPSPLVGYGLVIGLNKTGDRRQTIFSTQSLANMLTRFGVMVDAEQMKVENVAAVLVTAELSPFQRSGARVDVTASSIGDARSLQGGTLLPTSLRGPSGDMAALAPSVCRPDLMTITGFARAARRAADMNFGACVRCSM